MRKEELSKLPLCLAAKHIGNFQRGVEASISDLRKYGEKQDICLDLPDENDYQKFIDAGCELNVNNFVHMWTRKEGVFVLSIEDAINLMDISEAQKDFLKELFFQYCTESLANVWNSFISISGKYGGDSYIFALAHEEELERCLSLDGLDHGAKESIRKLSLNDGFVMCPYKENSSDRELIVYSSGSMKKQILAYSNEILVSIANNTYDWVRQCDDIVCSLAQFLLHKMLNKS